MKDFNLIHELRESKVDWETIKSEVSWFTDNDRKLYAGWLIGRETTDTNLVEHVKKKQVIRELRKELGIERAINNEQIRDIALHKTFTNQVIESIQSLNELPQHDYIPSPKVFSTAHIFTLADLHYTGDMSELESVYSAFDVITQEVIENKLESIYIFELGDVIEGASLRNSQLMGIKKGMVSQILDVAEVYARELSKLMAITNVTFVSVDSSNHTQLRNLGTKQNQLIEEDLMLVFNRFIENRLPNLHFVHDKDVSVLMLNFNIMIQHGHLIKNKEKVLENLSMNRNIQYDFAFIGHYHHMRSYDVNSNGEYDKRVFFVPSLNKFETQYERDLNLSSKAGVGYYVFNKVMGNVRESKLLI